MPVYLVSPISLLLLLLVFHSHHSTKTPCIRSPMNSMMLNPVVNSQSSYSWPSRAVAFDTGDLFFPYKTCIFLAAKTPYFPFSVSFPESSLSSQHLSVGMSLGSILRTFLLHSLLCWSYLSSWFKIPSLYWWLANLYLQSGPLLWTTDSFIQHLSIARLTYLTGTSNLL